MSAFGHCGGPRAVGGQRPSRRGAVIVPEHSDLSQEDPNSGIPAGRAGSAARTQNVGRLPFRLRRTMTGRRPFRDVLGAFEEYMNTVDPATLEALDNE